MEEIAAIADPFRHLVFEKQTRAKDDFICMFFCAVYATFVPQFILLFSGCSQC